MDSSPAIDACELLESGPVDPDPIYVACAGKRARLPRVAARVLDLCDGQHTLDQISTRTGQSRSRTRAVLEKLHHMGVIQTRRPPGFDDEDEAFFASELQPDEEAWEPPPTMAQRLGALVRRFRSRSR